MSVLFPATAFAACDAGAAIGYYLTNIVFATVSLLVLGIASLMVRRRWKKKKWANPRQRYFRWALTTVAGCLGAWLLYMLVSDAWLLNHLEEQIPCVTGKRVNAEPLTIDSTSTFLTEPPPPPKKP